MTGQKIQYVLPLLLIASQLNLDENEQLLNLFRVVFIVLELLSLGVLYYIKRQILSIKDTTEIVIPAEDGKAEAVATTYLKHETQQVESAINQNLVGAAISLFIHLQMEMSAVVVVQTGMIPLNLYDSPLLQKYIMNSPKRVWKETLKSEQASSKKKK